MKSIQTYSLLRYPKDSLLFEVAGTMLKATNEERGTVAGLAALSQDLNDEHADGMCSSILGANEGLIVMCVRAYSICSQPTMPKLKTVVGHVPPPC